MKISVITVCFNSCDTIEDTILSVLGQDFSDIEYIIVDGDSTDGTREIVSRYLNRISKYISEKDNGIYDAMNKGIRLASGDVVGILNSDDIFFDSSAISSIADVFEKTGTNCVFADLVYTKPPDDDKVVRYYRGKHFRLKHFEYGHQPPHPTCFIKKDCYNQFGIYNTEYQISADFELLLRFLWKHDIGYQYLPKTIVKMRVGGKSTGGLASTLLLNREILQACRDNGLKTNYLKIYSKYFFKLFQLVDRPK